MRIYSGILLTDRIYRNVIDAIDLIIISDRDLWVLFSKFQNRSDDQFFEGFFCSPAGRGWRRRGSRVVGGPEESGPQLKTQLMAESPAQQSNALDRGDGLR